MRMGHPLEYSVRDAMNAEYLAAAPLLALAGERLVCRGHRGELQAAGVALIVTGLLTLVIGFVDAAALSGVRGFVWQIMPVVYLAAFPVAIGAAVSRKWPGRVIRRLVFAGIALPALWVLLVVGPLAFLQTGRPIPEEAMDNESVEFVWFDFHTLWYPLRHVLGAALAVGPGAVLVWQSPLSPLWWLGAALTGLGGLALLMAVLRTASFWFGLVPV